MKPVTHHIAGIPFDECRQWYEDPTSIAELYEWMATDGTQPLNVALFIRNARQWEAQYLYMRSEQQRLVMLQQIKACRDADAGMHAPTDDHGVTDDQSAA